MYATQADLEGRISLANLAQLVLDDVEVEIPAAPLVALAGAGAGSLSAGSYRYRVTFVYPQGEGAESGISTALQVTTPASDGKTALSSIPLSTKGGTARRVYRTAAGGSDFKLVATITDNATTVYTDNLADASLGGTSPVPTALAGLIAMADALINSFLQDTYTLPLPVPTPVIIRKISTDLSCYYAMQRRFVEMKMPDDWIQTHKTAMDLLDKITNKEIVLDLLATVGGPEAKIVTSSADKRIDFDDPDNGMSLY